VVVIIVVFALYIPIGAAAFAADVAIINSEMVAVAQWLERNTPPDALIAAHDIGAIGYFTGRPLLDLAGLIRRK
jgi:DNA-binding LacI/PurR family transcriptional regulator